MVVGVWKMVSRLLDVTVAASAGARGSLVSGTAVGERRVVSEVIRVGVDFAIRVSVTVGELAGSLFFVGDPSTSVEAGSAATPTEVAFERGVASGSLAQAVTDSNRHRVPTSKFKMLYHVLLVPIPTY